MTQAARCESEYGDDPTWGPVRKAIDLAIETEGVESDETGDEYPGTGTLAEVGDWVASIRGTPEDNDYGQVMGIERASCDDSYITVRIAWEGSGVSTQVALSSLDVDVYTSRDDARDAYFATVPGGRAVSYTHLTLPTNREV